jgi:phospholipid transport system transporter-binding protein
MATIALPARLTMGDAAATLAQLQQALAGADAAPVLDASPLQALDTAAVAVLLECRRLAQVAGKTLTVQGAPLKLTELAQLYGVDHLLGLA